MGRERDREYLLDFKEALSNVESGAWGTGAQYMLGKYYLEGRGVSKDVTLAYYWFRRAAEKGHQLAQYKLGLMYSTGQGVLTNLSEAVSWYRKAAELGSQPAMFNLGQAYYFGSGVQENAAEAAKWYHKAAQTRADFGYWSTRERALSALGYLYAQGRGVSQSFVNAYCLWTEAANLGHPETQTNRQVLDNLQILRSSMTDDQIIEAKSLSYETVLQSEPFVM